MKDYDKLKEQIEQNNGKVKNGQLTSIVAHTMTNRNQFKNTITQWFMILCFPCKCKQKKKSYISAEKRFYKQLDIVNLLKTIRNT